MGEYDRAYSAYESVTAENRDDPEAHWCLMLCRYGINYVREEGGGFKPTISRMNRTPILEDPDYRAALRCSEKEIADQYRREAGKLADLQKRFLEIMKKEPPTDVFICFKAQEADGSHTRASEMGMDIYEELTARGLRVFFSRVTLENKIGEEYEPYIFSALYSAKVMLVVADKPEQLNARWVRNEWIRFLAMMDQDHSKAMIPVFRGMSPYDFPPEISMVQGQDMEKLGALQDLTGNVLKLCGKGPENVKLVQTAPEAGINVENILRRVKISMEERDFAGAVQRLEELLEKEPETGEAWFLKLLAKQKAQSWHYLDLDKHEWMDSREWKNAGRYADDNLRNQLEAIETNCRQRVVLKQAQKHMDRQEYEQAIELFATLGEFGKADRKLAECKRILAQRKNLIEYKKEIGDPQSYMRRRMEAEHPKEYEKMEALNRKADGKKAPFLDLGWGNLIIAAIIGGLFYVGIRNEGLNGAGVIFAVVAAIALAVLAGVVLGSFKIGIILAIILIVVLDKIPENITMIVGCIGCGAVELVCIPSGIASLRRRSVVGKAQRYYGEAIAPLEGSIRTEIRNRWISRVGEENLYPLEGCRKD